MESGIYSIRNTITQDFYIGSTNNFKRRWKYEHLKKLRINKHVNNYLQNAFNKYGEDVFIFEIILECEEEQLLFFEQFYLDLFKPKYNLTFIAGKPPSLKGRVVSEENKKKQSEMMKGNKNFLGKHHSKETKDKLSKANKGKKRDEATRRKIGEANKGKVTSEETKKKMSDAAKGKPKSREAAEKSSNARKGKHLSEAHKEKLSKAGKGKRRSIETRERMKIAQQNRRRKEASCNEN